MNNSQFLVYSLMPPQMYMNSLAESFLFKTIPFCYLLSLNLFIFCHVSLLSLLNLVSPYLGFFIFCH